MEQVAWMDGVKTLGLKTKLASTVSAYSRDTRGGTVQSFRRQLKLLKTLLWKKRQRFLQ
jgi:hypothetical protein